MRNNILSKKSNLAIRMLSSGILQTASLARNGPKKTCQICDKKLSEKRQIG